MNRIILIMLVMGFTSLSGLFSQVNEFTHPSIISFEKGTDPVKASSQSILSISDKHFKHGKKSLYWKWEKSGDSWLIKQPVLYAPVNPHHDNSVA
ncbi:MAG: chondroitinase family protein, partial [Paludibacter sp.]|nr:chondroitinase family protein [Paludibacter sp.]